MAYAPGRFCWYELGTSDTAAAQQFYAAVVGWNFRDNDISGTPYTMILAGETAIGGVMTLPEDVRAGGGRPAWLGYLAVDDVDGAATAVVAMGGTLHRAPADIPHLGRFAVVADRQQAPFVLFQPGGPPPHAPLPPGTPGRIAWHELMAQDWTTAMAFYSELLGWAPGGAVEIGAMGTYQMFTIAGETVGGMYNKPPMVPTAFWNYYIQVDDITAAARRVTQAGGTVLHGPTEVPGGDFIIQGLDPQGALFALVGKQSGRDQVSG